MRELHLTSGAISLGSTFLSSGLLRGHRKHNQTLCKRRLPLVITAGTRRKAGKVVKETRWRTRLEMFLKEPKETRIVLAEHKYTKEEKSAEAVRKLAAEYGLFSQPYARALVISKTALPAYDPNFDFRPRQRKLEINPGTQRKLQAMLEEHKRSQGVKLSSCSREGGTGSDRAEIERESGQANSGDEGPSTNGREGESWQGLLEAFERSQWADWDVKAAERRVHHGRRKRALEMFHSTSEGREMQLFRTRLPTYAAKEHFLEAVRNNQVVVVSGETGCGKTTQLPQYLLEEADAQGEEAHIVCTQPRRLAATSVATRVASERGEEVGGTVGYCVRLDAKRSRATRLLYCTTAVLLRRLIVDPALAGVTHIVVDEIHERGLDEDFLLIALRRLLPSRPHLRVVLMSATLNADLFANYFGNAPLFHIPGFTFPVKTLFLEDVVEAVGCTLAPRALKFVPQMRASLKKQEQPWQPLKLHEGMFAGYSRATREAVLQFDDNPRLGPDLTLVEAVVTYLCCGPATGRNPRRALPKRLPGQPTQAPDGAVLVFLTGWDEIVELQGQLGANPNLARLIGKGLLQVLPLHAAMPAQQQRTIFERPPTGVRKVVLATNVAETSITIDDVVYVIDCGLAKERSYDALNEQQSLASTWISKSSARQRRGRAGRLQPGVCYHLFPRAVFDTRMPTYAPPEIKRTPLAPLCLQVECLRGVLRGESIEEVLGSALEPPDARSVRTAVKELQEVGALTATQRLTPLGEHLAALPVEPRVGKLLLLGAAFHCLGPALTIAAALALKDPFVMGAGGNTRVAALEVRKGLAGATNSDHIAMLRAFDGWKGARSEGAAEEEAYCKDTFLSKAALGQMDNLRRQLMRVLAGLGLIDKRRGEEGYNSCSSDLHLVRALVGAALLPNLLALSREQAFGKVTWQIKTMKNGLVQIHPMSVNGRQREHHLPWMVYNEKMKTSNLFVRDTTPVCDYALLLFGGHVVADQRTQQLTMLDNHLTFAADPPTQRLTMDLRAEVQAILHKKLLNPRSKFHNEQHDTIQIVCELLRTGRTKGGFGLDEAAPSQEESTREGKWLRRESNERDLRTGDFSLRFEAHNAHHTSRTSALREGSSLKGVSETEDHLQIKHGGPGSKERNPGSQCRATCTILADK